MKPPSQSCCLASSAAFFGAALLIGATIIVSCTAYAQVPTTIQSTRDSPVEVPVGYILSETDGQWRIATGSSVTILNMNGQVLSGLTHCRPFNATMTGAMGRGQVRIGPLTARRCSKAARRAEADFLAKLASTQSFRVENDVLVARNLEGQVQFRATRGASASTPSSAARTINGSWQVSAINGRYLGLSGSPRPRVSISNTRLSIAGACNSFTGSIGFSGANPTERRVSILIASRTERLCADPTVEGIDQEVLGALNKSIRFTISGQELRFFDPEGKSVLLMAAM